MFDAAAIQVGEAILRNGWPSCRDPASLNLNLSLELNSIFGIHLKETQSLRLLFGTINLERNDLLTFESSS